MKITRIDTTYFRPGANLPWEPNWVWVRVHTNTGLVGLGETYPRNEAEASMVHSTIAGMLLGRDPRDIDRIWADFYRAFDFQVTGGTEMRALSAINLALWDILGQVPERSRLPTARREVQPGDSPLQHLLRPPLRLQQRAGKDHA